MPDRESLGGPAACEPPFIEALKRLGVEVEEEVYVYGDKLTRTGLGSRIKRVMRSARALRQRLDREDFDIVHLNTAFDLKTLLRDTVALRALKRRGRHKIFLKLHGSDGKLLRTRNPFLRLLNRRLLSRADGIGVLSSEEKENFTRAGAAPDKVYVVKNVVREAAPQTRAEFMGRMGVPPERAVLLFVARFIPAKGLIDVIRACAIVRDLGHEFVLFCLGDGPARGEAETEAKRLGLLPEHVRFLGYIPEEETREFYANGTMLVFPTYHHEGFPMVIFNSVAAGIPVITTRIRAAADYLSEPDNCLWVEPKNPSMLAEKIIHLLQNQDVREAMGHHNKELARAFTAERVAREYLEIYNQIIAGASGAPCAAPD